jgi:hypothetical protein
MLISITIAERVCELIEQHGSLRAAARAINLDPGYMARLRMGTKKAPSNKTLQKLSLLKEIKYFRKLRK